jgi:carbamoyl-phosphate synthase large subunit
VDRVYELTKISKWFLHKLRRLHQLDKLMAGVGSLEDLNGTLMLQILLKSRASRTCRSPSASARTKEEKNAACARRWASRPSSSRSTRWLARRRRTPTTCTRPTTRTSTHDITFNRMMTMVIGSGVYRIGSSVEFDWCFVSAIRTLRKLGDKSVMVNYNPETVSEHGLRRVRPPLL